MCVIFHWDEFMPLGEVNGTSVHVCGLQAARARNEDVGKDVRRGACPLPASDILGQIRKVVSSRLHTVAKDAADLDHAGSDVFCKEDLRTICDRHFTRLTSGQVQPK